MYYAEMDLTYFVCVVIKEGYDLVGVVCFYFYFFCDFAVHCYIVGVAKTRVEFGDSFKKEAFVDGVYVASYSY